MNDFRSEAVKQQYMFAVGLNTTLCNKVFLFQFKVRSQKFLFLTLHVKTQTFLFKDRKKLLQN